MTSRVPEAGRAPTHGTRPAGALVARAPSPDRGPAKRLASGRRDGPLPWDPDPRIPADDVAAPRGWRPAPEPEPAPRRPWRREQPDRPRGRFRRPWGKRARWLVRLVAAAAVVPAVVMLPLRWIDPPTTAFMSANPHGAVQQSVPIEHVSRNFLAAVIAHEDSQLPYRAGAF